MKLRITDASGNELEVGSRVRIYGPLGNLPEGSAFRGTIDRIGDPDGDLDEYGRPFSTPPYVTVRFLDGDWDTFPATREGPGLWKCGDLELGWPPAEPDKTIHVSSETLRRLQAHATAELNTPDKIISLLLDIAESVPSREYL